MNNLEITLNGKTQVIEVRAKDGYLNATQLCKVGGKENYEYFKLKSTKEYIEYLKSVPENPGTELIEIKQGGTKQGTWVHKKIAYHIASWISPMFMDQLIEVYDRMITGDLTLVRDVVENHDSINNTRSTILIQTQELDLIKKRKEIEIMDLEMEERRMELKERGSIVEMRNLENQHIRIQNEKELDSLDASGTNAYKASIDLLERINDGKITDTQRRFYNDLILNNNARRSTLLALESKEAYDARKERFLLPVSDLYKQVTGRAGNGKIWMALGKELAAGYRLKRDGKDPLKTESHVNGVTRMINAYNMRDDPWIEEYASNIINANKPFYN